MSKKMVLKRHVGNYKTWRQIEAVLRSYGWSPDMPMQDVKLPEHLNYGDRVQVTLSFDFCYGDEFITMEDA